MNWPEIYLICFGVGTLWALVSFLLGGFHLGHFGHSHSGHFGHAHSGTAAHSHSGHSHGGSDNAIPSLLASLLNPSVLAVFMAWFGGVGYLLTKYSGLMFWVNLGISVVVGFSGALILASFLRWLMGHERPLNPADFDMVGVLGHVSSTIRADGVGELIYVHEGVRRVASARSESGAPIARGEEVVVTHFDKGIAYVRTWEAMTQPASELSRPEASPKEN